MKRRDNSVGPLVPFEGEFSESLVRVGYDKNSIKNLVSVWRCLNYWLSRRGIRRNITKKHLEQFLRFRRRKGYVCWLSMRAMQPIILILADKGLHKDIKIPFSPVRKLVLNFEKYLLGVGGKLPDRSRYQLKVIESFLEELCGVDLDLTKLTPQKLRLHFTKLLEKKSRSYVRAIISMIRGFLRWAFIDGRISQELHLALPVISTWRRRVPKGLSKEVLAKLFKACDCRSRKGRKAYLILLLLSQMGLRRCEIAHLTLDDINWKSGTIQVRGKGKVSILPLPENIGKALSQHILRDRLKTIASRALFFRERAPLGPASSEGLQGSLNWLCRRAGLPLLGSHLFRHTAAMNMLKAGSTLREIAQVLRHSNPATTTIYAHAETESVAAVVRPWPGCAL